jgi:hypothetical protein
MLTRLAYLANYYLERDIAGRALFRLPDDLIVVAYPGSGGQWLRRLIANLLDPASPVTEANIQSRVPDLYHVSRRAFARIKNPRVIFSHECFDAEYGKAIYLIRDPRDVAVSLYEQRRQGSNLESGMSLERFVETHFIMDEEARVGWAEEFSGSIHANRGFGYLGRLKDEFLGTPASWEENVMSWIGARGRDPKAMLVLRYEELIGDPVAELGKVAEFLKLARVNVAATPERIRSAIQISQSQATPQAPEEWRRALPQTAVQAIESAWGSVMTAMGYALQAEQVEQVR